METTGVSPIKLDSKTKQELRRTPMSVPVRKLEVPAIPGYHLYWFTNSPDRIQRALDGGYEYVNSRELHVSHAGLGSNSAVSGNTDLGSQVSVVSGTDIGRDGQPVRLVLMKIRDEWYEEDRKLIESKNDAVAASLTGGAYGSEKETGMDARHRYVDKSRTDIPDLFKPKRPKAA